MFITICVIAYNEEQTLPAILKDIAAQDYAHGSMEVVLVDSASTDHTKKIMQEFAAQNTTQPDMGFVSVSVLDNPKRTLPCGWNVALKAYRGEAILKVDAHASIPKDFVTKNVAGVEGGGKGCGGVRERGRCVRRTKTEHYRTADTVSQYIASGRKLHVWFEYCTVPQQSRQKLCEIHVSRSVPQEGI